MSSPNYATDHGNGLADQFGSTTSAVNGSMMSGDQSSATIIGAMKPYALPSKSEESDSYIDKVSSVQSTLPTSSTTPTISTSNTTNATFSPAPMGNGGTDDVCRDFLRNMCRRGKSCRYKHPDSEGGGDSGMMMMPTNNAGSMNMGNSRKDNFVFCHDFQNRECRRENCRFMHCSKQEEEIFRSTGKLPNNMMAMVPPPPTMMPQGDGKDLSTPICKDFVNGICRRAPGRCKFRHPPSNDNYNQSPSPTNSRNSFDGRNGQRGAGGGGAPVGNFAMSPMNNSHNLDAYGYGRSHVPGAPNMGISPNYGYGNDQYADNGNPNKRKRYDQMPYAANNAVPYGASAAAYATEAMNPAAVHGYAMHSTAAAAAAAASAYYGGGAGNGGAVGGGVRAQMVPDGAGGPRGSFLEEENAALRRRIDDLKKQVSELLSTNEYLMEQINNMRGGPAAAVAVATATSVASLQPAPQSSAAATAVGLSSLSASQLTQSLSQALQAPPQCALSVPQPPPGTTTVVATPMALGPLPPVPASSIVSSIASISLPTVSAPVTALVSSSGGASLVSYTPLHSTNAWSLGVDQ